MPLKNFSDWFANVPPMFIDGALYFALAIFQFLQIQLASDEAGKFMSLELLWYLKTFVGSAAAGLLAIKLFRSTQFATHMANKKGDTAFLTKP